MICKEGDQRAAEIPSITDERESSLRAATMVHCPEIRQGFERFHEFSKEKSQEWPRERNTLKMDGYGTCEFFRSGSLKPKSAAKVIQTVSNSGQPGEFRGLRRVFFKENRDPHPDRISLRRWKFRIQDRFTSSQTELPRCIHPIHNQFTGESRLVSRMPGGLC